MKTIIHGREVHLEKKAIQNRYIIIENNHITKINNFSNSKLGKQQFFSSDDYDQRIERRLL